MKGTIGYGLIFIRYIEIPKDLLVGFVDADYASNLDNRKSQSGYVLTLFGTSISWKS